MKDVLSLKILTDHIFSGTILGNILHPEIFSLDKMKIYDSSCCCQCFSAGTRRTSETSDLLSVQFSVSSQPDGPVLGPWEETRRKGTRAGGQHVESTILSLFLLT